MCEPNSTSKNKRNAVAKTRRQFFLLTNVRYTLPTIKFEYSPMAMMVARDDQTRRDYYVGKIDLVSIDAIVDLSKDIVTILDLGKQFMIDLAGT